MMNPIAIIFTLIGGLFFAFSIKIISLTSIGEHFLFHQPWWVYLLFIGILFSGFKSLKHWLKEMKQRKQRKDPRGGVPMGANFFHSN